MSKTESSESGVMVMTLFLPTNWRYDSGAAGQIRLSVLENGFGEPFCYERHTHTKRLHQLRI